MDWLQAKLEEVDWDIKRELVTVLEGHYGFWRDLLAVLPDWLTSRISVQQLESVHSPTWALMQKLEQWDFTVGQLIACLETLNMDKALLIIKPDVDLQITEDLENYLEIEVGEPLCLTCRAKGFPTPYYQWFKNGQELLQEQCSKLIRNQASLGDSGVYRCKVYMIDRITNEEQPNSMFSTLCDVRIVEPLPPRQTAPPPGQPPVIELQPVSPGISLPPGVTFTLECRAKGDQPISYQWFKGNQPLSGETQSKLNLQCLLPDPDTGSSSWNFLCLVSNPFGKTVSDAVTVGLRATDPRNGSCCVYYAKDKVALLIANECYEHMDSFILPSSDVATLSEILKSLDFRVMSYLDLTLSEMTNAVRHFCSELGEGSYGFFYFAGHGFEDHGQSFMQPVDASGSCEEEENLCVDTVASNMQKQKPAMSMFLLDMCRERPEGNSNQRKYPARCYQQKRYENTIFGYATSFLGEAFELERCSNGLFVLYLKCHLARKKSVQDMLRDVKIAMSQDELAKRVGQHPVVSYDISEPRSLTDRIHDPSPEKKKYDRKWQEIYRCPDKEVFKLGTCRFAVTFRSHKSAFCNAIDVEVHFRSFQNAVHPAPASVALRFYPKSVKYVRLPQMDQETVKYTLKGLQSFKEPIVYLVVLKTDETCEELVSSAYSISLPGLFDLDLTRNMLGDFL